MSFTRRLRSRTIESAKEEIVKGVANVVENALKIPASPAASNSSDENRQTVGGQSGNCKLAAYRFYLLMIVSNRTCRTYILW